MPQQFSEQVEFLNRSRQITIVIDNETGTISFRDASGNNRITLDARGELVLNDSQRGETMKFESNRSALIIGGPNVPGSIFLNNGTSNQARVVITSGSQGGGGGGAILLGNNSTRGSLTAMCKDNGRFYINGGEGTVSLHKSQNGIFMDFDGNFSCKFKNNTVLDFNSESAELQTAELQLGARGKSGRITVNDDQGRKVFTLGKPIRRPVTGTVPRRAAPASTLLTIGARGNQGSILIKDGQGRDSITLNGSTGDITLKNADFAEDFDIIEASFEEIDPGTVMVLTQEGKLEECRSNYDKKVVGIISGAGDYKPGIILDKQPELSNRLPVALSGKVWCKVDAGFGSILTGDLLTTSESIGYAMKAIDPSQAFGSIIGKALSSLESGKGLIPVLVSLQ